MGDKLQNKLFVVDRRLGGKLTNLYRAMIRNPGTYDHVVYPIKTGFLGKGLFVKTTFTLIKLR